MVSAIRMARRERQKKHIPSKLVFDPTSNHYIKNPLLRKKKEDKKGDKKNPIPPRTTSKR